MIGSFSGQMSERIASALRKASPRIKELLFTSRTQVEVLKTRCVAIEKEFKQSRETLKERERDLQAIKEDLRTLYTQRANEYLKPRQQQQIKQINEDEIRLNELEKEAFEAANDARIREQELFNTFKASSDILYQKSLVYANRFVILSIAIGASMMVWKGLKWTVAVLKGDRVAKEGGAGVQGGVSQTGFDLLEQSLISTNSLLSDLNEAQKQRFDQLWSVLEKKQSTSYDGQKTDHHTNTITERKEITSADNNPFIGVVPADSSQHAVADFQNSKITVLFLAVVGGVVGATVAMVFTQR